MFPSVFLLKRFIVLVALSWALLLILMHRNLLMQHRESENSAAQILTGNMLKIRCGNEISVLRDRLCIKRFKWVIMNWIKDKCFGELGVTSKSDIDCSVYQYLVFVERVCQIPQNAEALFAGVILSPTNLQLQLPQTQPPNNFTHLFEKLDECGKVCQWIKARVNAMSSDWLKTSLIPPDHQSQTAGKNFTQAHVIRGLNSFPSQSRPRLRLLLHMGLLTEEYGLNFGLGALAGGPLGELVQWADLMSALHVLGYEVVLSWSPKRLKNILIPNRDRGKTCQPGRTVDLVFTDINGLEQRNIWATLVEPKAGEHHAINLMRKIRGVRSLPLRGQIREQDYRSKALLYGKRSSLLNGRGKRKYLDKIHKYFKDMHATLWSKDDDASESDIPSYVINHKHLEQQEFLTLLRKSSVFVGLGWPLEGPAALEAIANGAVFLNPKFVPERFVDAGKPTNRKVTSQNPYAERIGEPHVYTVNMKDLSQVEDVLKEIALKEKPEPFVPHEFSFAGYLERLQAYIENQDFCDEPVRKIAGSNRLWKQVKQRWPPLSVLQIKTSKPSESCTSACSRHQMTCERSFFADINSKESFRDAHQHCINHHSINPRFEYRDFLETKGEYEQFQVPCHAPSYTTSSEYCYTQQDHLLFSCACTPPSDVVRLCPCRQPRKEQIALTNY